MKPQARDITALEDALGHRFRRQELLEQALTHASFAREAESIPAGDEHDLRARDNEQLEFLGDAVLAYVISQELFRRFPEYTEGELSKLRGHLVSARHLVRPARLLDLGSYLRLGRGEEKSGGRSKSALLVNALEAIIAALFLDAGSERAHRFIVETILEPELTELSRHSHVRLAITDYKSALQEAVHASGRPQPRYTVVKEEGPEHRKTFTIEANVPAGPQGEPAFAARAEGSTKKRAEQRAARQAWEHLQSLQGIPAAGASGLGGDSSQQA